MVAKRDIGLDKVECARYNTLTRSNSSLSQGTPDYPPEAKKSNLKIRE